MIAPGYHPEALELLSVKKNRRMLFASSDGAKGTKPLHEAGQWGLARTDTGRTCS